MGPIGCPETSVEDYHSTLRNIQEERSSHHLTSYTSVITIHDALRTANVRVQRGI
jgi:hypothetical protein